AQIINIRLISQVERATAEVSRLGEQFTADIEALDDSALTAALNEAKIAEARAILARDEEQRAVEGLNEAALSQQLNALRKRRERLVNDRLELVGEIAQLEERAKTLGGAGPATRAAATSELEGAASAAYAR